MREIDNNKPVNNILRYSVIFYEEPPIEIAFVEDVLDDCVIYGEYTVTKEDCEFVGQVDLKEAYRKMLEEGE